MMLVAMIALSGAIMYAWFQSLDFGLIAQNPIEQIAQTGNTKEELTPLKSLWLNAQILGVQFRKAGAGLNLIREKIFGMRNDTVMQQQGLPGYAVEENKKSFFGTIKDVVKYNIGIMESFFR